LLFANLLIIVTILQLWFNIKALKPLYLRIFIQIVYSLYELYITFQKVKGIFASEILTKNSFRYETSINTGVHQN